MRLHLFAVVIAAVSLVQCSFDGFGLTGNTLTTPDAESTGEGGTTEDEPTTGDPTVGAVCGNFMIEDGEECDNGASNNGGGALCKEDCVLNKCGDGYLAPAVEGCDDGNLDNDDDCTSTCTSKNCGDGVTDGVEQCDDGNSVDEDGCSNLCRLPVCGDGIVNGTDECDDPNGNSDMGSCTAGCKTAKCGDGLVHEGVESCDDGNAVDDDGCSNACAAASCGDGELQNMEECDAGAENSETGMCLPSCLLAKCGDTFIQAGVEDCDDGNDAGGDGCSAACKEEVCGNGIADPGEDCDDGNTNDADDCRNDCFAVTCGDGIVAVDANKPEQCDDGNVDDTDACPSTCEDATCGDGFLHKDVEECDPVAPSDTCDENTCKRNAWWVFTTSTKYIGSDIMSAAQADMACTTLADNKPAIKGVYKAWLSDDTDSADDRLFHSTVPYIRTDKSQVADNWTDLTDGSLDVSINRNESNQSINIMNPPTNCNANNAKEAAVWTGTNPNASAAETCNDWDEGGNGMMGQAGMLNRVDMLWSNCDFPCDTMARLYCIEQPAG